MDGDGDGVPDGEDGCPGTPPRRPGGLPRLPAEAAGDGGHAGDEYSIRATASKDGDADAQATTTIRVWGPGLELGYFPVSTNIPIGTTAKWEIPVEDDVRCYPWCRAHCRYHTAIIDHDIHDNTPCDMPATCSLGHDLRYEWTADGGTICAPASRGMTWRPPATPGEYTIRGTTTCSEDPNVRASFEEEIGATTRELS